jgi:hypothetical protein
LPTNIPDRPQVAALMDERRDDEAIGAHAESLDWIVDGWRWAEIGKDPLIPRACVKGDQRKAQLFGLANSEDP